MTWHNGQNKLIMSLKDGNGGKEDRCFGVMSIFGNGRTGMEWKWRKYEMWKRMIIINLKTNTMNKLYVYDSIHTIVPQIVRYVVLNIVQHQE